MVYLFKLKSFDHLLFNITVRCIDLGVFLRGGNLSKLLVNTFFLKVLSDNTGYKLGSIIIADGYCIDNAVNQQQRQQNGYIALLDVKP